METKDRVMVKPSANTKNASNPVNGSEKKATESKAQAMPKQSEAKPEQPKAEAELKPATKVLPITRAIDRLGKFEQFQKLGERYNFLKDKDRELRNFTISQNGVASKVSLECQGSKVEISNSLIIKKVVELCQSELDSLLDETESEIVKFEI